MLYRARRPNERSWQSRPASALASIPGWDPRVFRAAIARNKHTEGAPETNRKGTMHLGQPNAGVGGGAGPFGGALVLFRKSRSTRLFAPPLADAHRKSSSQEPNLRLEFKLAAPASDGREEPANTGGELIKDIVEPFCLAQGGGPTLGSKGGFSCARRDRTRSARHGPWPRCRSSSVRGPGLELGPGQGKEKHGPMLRPLRPGHSSGKLSYAPVARFCLVRPGPTGAHGAGMRRARAGGGPG